MISEEIYHYLKSERKSGFESLYISKVIIGLHLTAVKLSDGSYGVASTLENEKKCCRKSDRDFDEFSPSKIKGRKITDLFEFPKPTNLIKTLRIAVLNAISSSVLSEKKYKILENTDPVDLIDLSQNNKTITIVGAFQSYIRKISVTGNKLYVLELDENSLPEEHKQFYVPPADFQKVIPSSDIVIITGLTLVNDTIDGLLAAVPSTAQLIVVGPSSSVVPDILFRNGIDIIGATRVFDGEKLFTIAGEAGAGYHLFKYCATKISVLNDPQTGTQRKMD